jgi:hypothetical protein
MKKVVFGILALTLSAAFVSAQSVTSNTQTVSLNAVISEAITLDAPSAAVVNFAIAGSPFSTSTTNGDVAPTFNLNYSLKAGRTVNVCTYLSAPLTGATSGNTDTITANGVLAKFNSTGNYVQFGGNTACGIGSGLVIESLVTTAAVHSAVRNEKVELQIGPLGGKTPDTYTGTLNFVAQAI